MSSDLKVPEPTTNSLRDVIGFIGSGDVVRLTGTRTLVYHKCSSISTLQNTRLVSLRLAKLPSLTDEDEWPYYLKDAKCSECTCALKDAPESAFKAAYAFEL
jgi:hypothetical protein